MIIQLAEDISPDQELQIIASVKDIGYKVNPVTTQHGKYLVGIGKREFDIRKIGHLPGIADIHRVSDDYKLVSRKWKVNPTLIDLGDSVKIGSGLLTIMAAPCSIESEAQIEATIGHLVENSVCIMRGGVFKPRSSPYAFRGLGREGLQLWHTRARKAGIKIISEVMQVSQVAEMYDYVDIFPAELPKQLPPNRGLGDEHHIEMDIDAVPPKKAAYR